jgi:hypothetical protein
MKLRRAALAGAAAACLVLVAPQARAADQADTLDIQAALTDEGLLNVTQTLHFTAAPDTVSQVFAVSVDQGDGRNLVYELTELTATADGAPLAVDAPAKSGQVSVTLATAGAQDVTLSYTVRGATQLNPDDSIRAGWDFLQGLSVGVAQVTGRLELPPGVKSYFCEGGVPGATEVCGTWQGGVHGSLALSFTDGPRAAGDVVTAGAQFRPGSVPVTAAYETRWSLSRAFSLGWSRVGLAAGITALGGLALFGVYRRGRQRLTATPAELAVLAPDAAGYATFTVRDGLRPGLAGTLIDQSVDPSDVLATLLDLAVRGHLRITELPRANDSAAPDWTLARRDSADPLEDYEAALLEAVAPAGRATPVSGLGDAITPAIARVQEALYRRVVEAGWLARPPGSPNPWARLAWLAVAAAVVVTGVLVWFTTWALAGLALVVVALIGLLVAQEAPLLTERGGQVLAGLGQLSAGLHTAPTALTPGREYADAAAILPYAIVLGGWDRWLGALVAGDADQEADPEDLDWYHAPATWHLQNLPDSLDAFITVVTGRLFARA